MQTSFRLLLVCVATLCVVANGIPDPFQGKGSVPPPPPGPKGGIPVLPPPPVPRRKNSKPPLPLPPFRDNSDEIVPPPKFGNCGSSILLSLQKCVCFALFKDMLPLQSPNGANKICLKIFKTESAIMNMNNPCTKFMIDGKISRKKVMTDIKLLKKKCLPSNFNPRDMFDNPVETGKSIENIGIEI